ncbi:MAG: LLM class F420-dependent oxidoreductase [Myxococcota bacterium]
MKLGFYGIGSGTCSDPGVALRVARAAEAAGFESVWTGEHVVLPDPRVPPSPASPRFPMLDPGTLLAYLAGATSRLRLGTGVVILPQRNPLVLAKQLATLDRVSEGRLIFGVGVGYLRPEFEALGVSFADRGERTDEYLEAIRALWTHEKPAYQGRFVAFSGVDAQPRPVQKPHPPIVIGGHSRGALRRAVRRAEGWYGFALDLEGARRCIEEIARTEREVGRPAALGRLEISITPIDPLDRDGARRFEDLGVDRLIPLCRERSGDEIVRFVEKLAGRVL